MEAMCPGDQSRPETGDQGYLLVRDAGRHSGADLFIALVVPQPASFEQRVSDPQVGVGGWVGIENPPVAIGGLTPVPARQPLGKIAGGKISLGPMQQFVEARTIV